jgi:hypothetical protein
MLLYRSCNAKSTRFSIPVLGRTKIKYYGSQGGFSEFSIKLAGGKLISHYYTFGRYDFVATVELPSAEILAKVFIEIGKSGTISTETMTALLPEEMYKMAMGM